MRKYRVQVAFANAVKLADAGVVIIFHLPLRLRVVSCLALLLALCVTACSRTRASSQPQAAQAQTVQAQTAQTTTSQRLTSAPYAGDLSIFEYPERDKKLQIDRVMDLLGIKPGKSVADVGAGSGWFTVRAARRVGTEGTVLAEDINPGYIKYIADRAQNEKLPNVKTVLGTPDDPMIPAVSVDALLMLKVYHEIAHPVPVLVKLRSSLRVGAKLGIIDRNGSGTDHGLNSDIVVKEMREAGYKLVAKYDFTKADGQDYFLIFVAATP